MNLFSRLSGKLVRLTSRGRISIPLFATLLALLMASASISLVPNLGGRARAQGAIGAWTERPAPRGAAWVGVGAIGPYTGVVFGGQDGRPDNQTLAFDGARWNTLSLSDAARPAPRDHAAFIALDSARALLFGGADATGPRGDLWELTIAADGSGRWRDVTPVAAPGGAAPKPGTHPSLGLIKHERRDGSMTRGPFALLYGAGSAHDETWLLRPDAAGYVWERQPVAGPGSWDSPVLGSLRVCDQLNCVTSTALLGGAPPGSGYHDMWFYELTGEQGSKGAWVQRAIGGTPPPDSLKAVAVAPGADELAVFSIAGSGALESWRLRATAPGTLLWQPVAGAGAPSGYERPVVIADRDSDRYLLVAGRPNAGIWSLTPSLGKSGDSWAELETSPAASRTTLMAYGGGQLNDAGLLVYDYARRLTWLHDGQHWRQLATATTPPPLRDARLVAAPNAQAIYLIGSGATAAAPIEIWRFQGGDWGQVAAGGGPNSQYAYGFHATYDPHRQRILFFGGSQQPIEQLGAGAQLSADFWSLDPLNGQWSQLAICCANQRAYGTLVWDAARQRAVLFGGIDAAGALSNETWLLGRDGEQYNWSQATGSPAPAARALAGGAYDPVRARIVLFGGSDRSLESAVEPDVVWEFDQGWLAVPAGGPPPRHSPGLAYVPDASGARVALVGGIRVGAASATGSAIGDQWDYRGPSLPPTPTRTATATPTSTPSPTITPSPTATTTPTPDPGYRDVGAVRVWADRFEQRPDGSTIASGNIVVGARTAGESGKYFSIGDSVAWNAGDTIAVAGRIAFAQGGLALAQGTFSANRATGVLTWQPGATALYTKLGSSEIAIAPTMAIKLTDSNVEVSAAVALALPESQAMRTDIRFRLGPDGTITALAPGAATIKIAGATLTAQVLASADGLVAATPSYSVDGIPAITLPELVIDGKGDAKLHFRAGQTFPMPDLDLGNGVFVLREVRGQLGVTTQSGSPAAYTLDLSGTMQISNLPENPTQQAATANLTIAAGKLEGKLPGVDIKVAGQSTKLTDIEIKRAGTAYQLLASKAEIDVIKAWLRPSESQAPKITITNLSLMPTAPFLSINGTFATTQKFYLAGDEYANVSVRFDRISGKINHVAATNSWDIELNATLTFKFGKDSSTTTSGKLVIRRVQLGSDVKGEISGQLTGVSLTIAGIGMTVGTLDYKDNIFKARTVTLKLPKAWGEETLTINELEISSQGVKVGGGSFTIADQQLWQVLTLSGMKAAFAIDNQQQFSVAITATATISKVQAQGSGNSVTAGGTLQWKNGRVSGTFNTFGFKLVGIEFQASEVKFLDDKLTAEKVRLKLPQNLGGVGTELRGLEIGGDVGFKFRGGGFRLPDFTIGTVGIKNVEANFWTLPDGSISIKAGAKLGFEAFSVEGGFTLVYTPQTSQIHLQQVKIAFEGRIIHGTAIPLGNTGLFLTSVSGEFDLTGGSLVVRFGVKASFATDFQGISLFSTDGEVVVKAQPFELTTNANAYVLGLQIAEVNVRITPTSFRLDGMVELQVARATVTLAFGIDADHEFTVYGSAAMEVGLRRGSIGCFAFVCLPPSDWTLTRQQYEMGKFRHSSGKVWGARTQQELFGLRFYVFARVAPDQGLDVGTDLQAYQPVLPAGGANQGSGRTISTVEIDKGAASLMIAEAITSTNRTELLPLLVTGPDGAQIQPKLEYESGDHALRTYSIPFASPDQAIGKWTLSVQTGNETMVWASDPAPQVGQFAITASTGQSLASAAQQPTPRLTFSGGESFTLNWNASDNSHDFDAVIYAENEHRQRYYIASRSANSETQLAGTTLWAPALPSGTYTFTLALDDAKHATTYAHSEPIVIEDATPPAAPRDLRADARPDGSVLLTWDGAAAGPDVQGYRIALAGHHPLMEQGRLARYDLFGLAPGSTYQIEVAAYDLSGNVSPAATIAVTTPAFGASALTPRRDGQAETVAEVQVILTQPGTTTELTVRDAQGNQLPGSVKPIEAEIGVDQVVTIGASFVPDGGALPVGEYTATVTAQEAATGATMTTTWSFRVVVPSASTALSAGPAGGAISEPAADRAYAIPRPGRAKPRSERTRGRQASRSATYY
jgi:hypothetical protein